MNKYIKIAADSIEQLRKQDVFRVLESAPTGKLNKVADFIKLNRPDLIEEAKECLIELL